MNDLMKDMRGNDYSSPGSFTSGAGDEQSGSNTATMNTTVNSGSNGGSAGGKAGGAGFSTLVTSLRLALAGAWLRRYSPPSRMQRGALVVAGFLTALALSTSTVAFAGQNAPDGDTLFPKVRQTLPWSEQSTAAALKNPIRATTAFGASNVAPWLGQMIDGQILDHSSSDWDADDAFAWSVAMDGDHALIGAPFTGVSLNDSAGLVYAVFKHNGYWEHPLKLYDPVADSRDEFGNSVAMDGDTAVIGARLATIGGNDQQGTAYVFTLSGEVWTQVAQLTASDGASLDDFGGTVAISGNTIMVGSPTQQAVYVFTGSGGTWTEKQKLSVNGFGGNGSAYRQLAIDGTTALIGGQNTVYVWTESGGTWTQTQEIDAPVNGDLFGVSVALSGSTAVIGAPGLSNDKGMAYVFSQSGGQWTQTEELAPDDGTAGDGFGSAVGISGDMAVIGAPFAFPGGFSTNPNEPQGAAYVFSDSGGTWTQAKKLYALTDADTFVESLDYGMSIAISGNDLLIGEPEHDSERGNAFFYNNQPADVDIAVSDPETVGEDNNYVSQITVTNNSSTPTGGVTVYAGQVEGLDATTNYVSFTSSQGTCYSSGLPLLTCDLGALSGGGAAQISVTYHLYSGSSPDATIIDAAAVEATPPLTASAVTTVSGATNNPPVASDGSLTTDENTAASGMLSASDPDGDALTFGIVDQPSHGSVTIDDASSGAYTYTPDADYTGADSFTFKANDGQADSNTATVSITVNAATPPPPSSSGSGGGGAVSPFGLMLLVFAASLILIRRRLRHKNLLQPCEIGVFPAKKSK